MSNTRCRVQAQQVTMHILTRYSHHMADQSDGFHVIHVAQGEMQLSLSLVVYKKLASVWIWSFLKVQNEKQIKEHSYSLPLKVFILENGMYVQQQKYSEDNKILSRVIWILRREQCSNTWILFSVPVQELKSRGLKYALRKYVLSPCLLNSNWREKKRLHPQ